MSADGHVGQRGELLQVRDRERATHGLSSCGVGHEVAKLVHSLRTRRFGDRRSDRQRVGVAVVEGDGDLAVAKGPRRHVAEQPFDVDDPVLGQHGQVLGEARRAVARW